MKNAVERNNSRGILSRIMRDQAGNTIAIMAAAVLPVIGLVGASVDIGRIYLVKTRMQSACDAGSLMGRKVMGNGTWAANSNAANTQAQKIFDLNFNAGDYGTADLTRTFTEAAGNVTGIATVGVKTTLMRPVMAPKMKAEQKAELFRLKELQLGRALTPAERANWDPIFDQQAEEWAANHHGVVVSVNCQSEMAIPNSDVMFVLDVTGSMDDDDANGVRKIDGLKKATKCFFEALQKEDISSVSPTDCGTTANPSGGNASDVAIRFGFVPYSVNVNVGKLLPLTYVADSWTYQSREPNWIVGTTWSPVYGTETTPVEYGTPDIDAAEDWSDWDNTSNNVVIGSTTYSRRFNSTEAECNATSAPSEQSSGGTGSMQFQSQNPNPPVHPTTTSVARYYKQTTSSTSTQYKYEWSSSNGGRCRLKFKTRNNGSTTRNYSTTVPVTWELSRTFNGWTYKPVTFNVSGLKDTANNAWRSSVSIPIGTNGANIDANWSGCLEERQTARVMDGDPSNDWSPVPAGAKDMNIDLIPGPTDPTTQWGPMLKDVVYGRHWNGSRTTNNLGPNDFDWNEGQTTQYDPSCPVEAKLYKQWDPTAFDSYVNSLQPTSYTYHDVGLLWGARLMSPTGMFSGLNAPANKDIQRHMVFMTDGDTNADINSYSSFGMDWWDRRQNDGTSAPSDAWLESNINARSQAICTWVKNKNITLWVISFGTDVNSATQTNLQNCASPGKFFTAAKASDLVDNFRAIASEISLLRLTS